MNIFLPDSDTCLLYVCVWSVTSDSVTPWAVVPGSSVYYLYFNHHIGFRYVGVGLICPFLFPMF